MKVPFLDLKAQYATVGPQIEAEVVEVLRSGGYVLGPKVAAFEEAFATLCGTKHAVACNSGTSALHLAFVAHGIRTGDEVIVPAMSFTATAAAVRYTGATPVFVDIEATSLTLDPALIEAAITPATKAIVPVHLYGQPARMDDILAIAKVHGLPVIEDAAQAHGALDKGRPVGGLGRCGCFSFYPGKNLGACGEAGIVVTNDDGLAEDMRAHRDWGQKVKHDHSLIGFNYRMDGVQGAALGVKIKYLAQWSKARQTWAALYDNLLSEAGFEVLPRRDDVEHVHHVYGILHPDRDSLQAALQAKGIGTNIHYPVPLHKQTVYADLGQAGKSCPVAERVGAEELSLPMFAELGESAVRQVVAELVASAET